MNRAIAAAALALTAVACALSAAGPTAPGSTEAWNHRSDYLRFPAPKDYTRCTSRRPRLSGNYRWGLYHQHWAHPDATEVVYRHINLRGVYRLIDCLHYHRSSPGAIPYYRHRSWLRNERTGGEALYQQSFFVWGIEGVAGDGWYDWGSTLDRW